MSRRHQLSILAWIILAQVATVLPAVAAANALSAPAAVSLAPRANAPSAAAAAAAAAANRSGDWTFAPNVRVHAETSGQHLWPDIAKGPGGLVGLAWMDDHAAGGFHIYYCASTDGGLTWSAPEKIDDRSNGAYSKFVSLEFTPGGIAVAAWEDDRLGPMNVYLSRRDPAGGGSPWTPNVRVNVAGGPANGGDFMNPSLAVLDESRFFVAWTDWREGAFNQVYSRRTTDAGLTWSVERRISDEIGYQPVAANPCLVIDPASTPGHETLYCLMDDWRGNVPGGRYPDVYFSRSTDGGTTWANGVRVNDITDWFQQCSSRSLVKLPDGTLTAAWMSGYGSYSFRTCVSTNGGATWNPSARVDDPVLGGVGTWSSIAASGNLVVATFEIYQRSWDEYFRASPDGGRTWTDPVVRMDDDTTESATGNSVVAALSPTEVVAAWQDTRPPDSAWKIYASRGTRSTVGVPGDEVGGGADGWEFAAGPRLLCQPNPSRAGDAVRIVLDRPVARTAEASPSASGDGPSLGIFDTSGRLVRVLDFARAEAWWDGRDAGGTRMPSGVYWARFTRPASDGQSRIVRLR